MCKITESITFFFIKRILHLEQIKLRITTVKISGNNYKENSHDDDHNNNSKNNT